MGHRLTVSLHQLTISFVGSSRTMRDIDAIVRNGTETASSMNDMIKESIKQIEVICLRSLQSHTQDHSEYTSTLG